MTAHLPSLSPKRILRILEQIGFVVHHTTGSHNILKHPGRPLLRVTLPMHRKDLKRGTFAAILKQAELTSVKFRELL